jgi:hypothetical protein
MTGTTQQDLTGRELMGQVNLTADTDNSRSPTRFNREVQTPLEEEGGKLVISRSGILNSSTAPAEERRA